MTEHDPGRLKPASHLEPWNSDLESEGKAGKSSQLSTLPGQTWGLLNSKTQFPASKKFVLKSEGVDSALKNSVSPSITHWSAQVSGTDQSPYPKYFSSKKEEEHREASLWDLVCSVWHDTPSQLSMPVWSYSHPREHPAPAMVILRKKRSLQCLRPVWMIIKRLSQSLKLQRLKACSGTREPVSHWASGLKDCHTRIYLFSTREPLNATAEWTLWLPSPGLQTTQTAAVHINSRSWCPERNWVTSSKCGFLSV